MKDDGEMDRPNKTGEDDKDEMSQGVGEGKSFEIDMTTKEE